MTKVYLVTGTYYVKNKFYTVSPTVFTNRKLAENYCKYRNLTPKPNWMKENEYREYKVEEKQICRLNYEKDLLKLQMEQLPY